MTRTELVNTLNTLGNDVSYDEYESTFNVTIEDFEGFDDNWNEIYRDYDNPQAVEDFENMLENECNRFEGDFYRDYYFNDFTVRLGYSSYDI